MGIVKDKMDFYNNIYRRNHSSKYKYTDGLGIMIAKEIINSINGTIKLSESSYGGLMVTVVIPIYHN